MFHFGFSYVGLLYLLMLFIPNIIWTKSIPEGYKELEKSEKKSLLFMERAGEVLCSCCVLIFADFNIRITYWSIWLITSFLLMLLYEVYWIRYFKSKRTLKDFYRKMLCFKVPAASLPVMAFFLLGIYGCNIFLMISSVILGIGHIAIHLSHYDSVIGIKKGKIGHRILKAIIYLIIFFVLGVIAFVIGCRNIRYIKHYKLVRRGIDETVFTNLGGQEQYILMRGNNVNNPVIIYLHGGPSCPDTYVSYAFSDELLDDYTVIAWDQRGCGRTYVYNESIDPQNETATFSQALTDLDELVDMARERFGQEKVIIMGHSYGTVLGTEYIAKHPEKVQAYIGLAQMISMDISNEILYQESYETAKKQNQNQNLWAIEAAYHKCKNNRSVKNTMLLRNVVSPYIPKALPEKSTWYAVTSPYFGENDFKWFLKQIGDFDEYLNMNKALYTSLLDYNLYDVKIDEKVPLFFISGTKDYICPVSAISEYVAQKPENRKLYLIEECGHNVQYTLPGQVSSVVKDVLSNIEK